MNISGLSEGLCCRFLNFSPNISVGYPRRRAVRGHCEHEAGSIALGSNYLSRMSGRIGVKVSLHPQGMSCGLSLLSAVAFGAEHDWSFCFGTCSVLLRLTYRYASHAFTATRKGIHWNIALTTMLARTRGVDPACGPLFPTVHKYFLYVVVARDLDGQRDSRSLSNTQLDVDVGDRSNVGRVSHVLIYGLCLSTERVPPQTAWVGSTPYLFVADANVR